MVANAAGFCLAWNQQRPRSFPELVILQFQAALSTGEFLPDRREGIATLVDLDPSRGDQAEQVEGALAQLNRRSASARNRESAKDLYGYSRLLDLERLLYLLQLLSRFPGLCAADVENEAVLTAICNPTPQGSMAQQGRRSAQRIAWQLLWRCGGPGARSALVGAAGLFVP